MHSSVTKYVMLFLTKYLFTLNWLYLHYDDKKSPTALIKF